MPPIITTLGVNSFRPSGGAGLPTSFEILVIAGGGGWRGGAGGLMIQTATDIDFFMDGIFTVDVGALGGNSSIIGDATTGTTAPIGSTYVYAGGVASNTTSNGFNGGSGGGGYSWYAGGSSIPAYTYPAHGTYGGTGARYYNMNYGGVKMVYGGGGGHKTVGGNGTANSWTTQNGYGGGGSQLVADLNWHGVYSTDWVVCNGSGGGVGLYGAPSTTGGGGKYGDADHSGVVAIRYDPSYSDPTVTGSPTFYDDTVNSKRQIIWTASGSFQW